MGPLSTLALEINGRDVFADSAPEIGDRRVIRMNSISFQRRAVAKNRDQTHII